MKMSTTVERLHQRWLARISAASRTLAKRCLLVGFAAASASASASLVRVDDSSLGFLGSAQDGFNITRDAGNNLDWLDWDLTTNYSFNTAQPLLESGGILDGWRFAQAEDFLGLALSAAIPSAHFDNFVPGNAPDPLVALATALGITRAFDESAFAVFDEPGATGTGLVRLGGISLARPMTTTNPSPSGSRGRRAAPTVVETTASIIDIPNDPQIWIAQSWQPAMVHETIGMALVRQSFITIPEPYSLGLMLLGLAGMVAVRRRQPVLARQNSTAMVLRAGTR